MKEHKITELDFIIDRLSDSIINTYSGDSFQTNIARLTKTDLKQVTKKNGWAFEWATELKRNDRDVYKLTIVNNPDIIQGLLSFTIKSDNVFMHLLESATFNRGKDKVYEGVSGNLVAFTCKMSFQHGCDGFVSFHSKSKLIDHYKKTLGAYHFRGQLMVVPTDAAQNLIDKYFKT